MICPSAGITWAALILACVFCGGLAFLFGALYAFEQQTFTVTDEEEKPC